MASGNLPMHIMAGDGDADTSAGCLATVCGSERLLQSVEAEGSTKSQASHSVPTTITIHGVSRQATQQSGVTTSVKEQACHAAQGLLQLSSTPNLSSGHLPHRVLKATTAARQARINKSVTAVPKSVSREPGKRCGSLLCTQADFSSVDQSKSPELGSIRIANATGNSTIHFTLAASSTDTNLVAMTPDVNMLMQSNNSGTRSRIIALNMERKEPVKIGLKASESDLEKLRCSLCNYQSFYHQQHQDHLRQTHGNIVLCCKCCSHVAPSEDLLVTHYTELHPRNICTQCGLTSEHAYIIKRHMYRHTSEGCACDVCGKNYKDQYILKMHIKMVHTPADVLYECSECTKKFTRKAHLKRHQRIHSAEKPFKCPHCDYRGCERSDISKHILIHDEPHHTCEVCGKTFRHLKNMELHIKRHKGQRDYKCGVCEFYGYTFTDIRKHIERKHTEYKTSICDYCGQLFKSESVMKEHQRSAHAEVESNNGNSQVGDGQIGVLTPNSALLADDTTGTHPKQATRRSAMLDGSPKEVRGIVNCDEKEYDVGDIGLVRIVCR